nr:hypothetical protein [Klebsiella pneumoniae]
MNKTKGCLIANFATVPNWQCSGRLRSWWYSSRLVAKLKAAHSRLAGKRS